MVITMDKRVFGSKIVYSILSVLLMSVGAYLMIRPENSLALVCHMIGILLIIFGTGRVIGYFPKDMYELAFQFDFATGIFLVIIGFILVFHTNYILTVLPTFIGAIIMLDSLFKMQIAIDAKKFGLRKWWAILAIAIATNIAGIFLIIRPIDAAAFVFQLLGLNLVLDGGLNLLVVLYTVKSTKVKKWEV